ncbi:putative bifunctional diguanylate cyclase/phosphodiesterase [Aliamphritea spongicola]|uniref:putative bifunctional diguanylate cyclase/phosphodiesterase n=1 Tax=Aliamphritea spongicola TaxID=707589 RepID=UPI00196B7C81|nr:EAL domain-containing protein [Aliamphritea spongicola]MBN3564742.1 EAL domain-containing protein [Aliamphritea spongicola]
MIKSSSRTSIIIATMMIVVIMLSMFSSFWLFRQISSMQVGPTRSELVFFMRQYEYELMRTAAHYAEAYPTPRFADSQERFDTWFNILWSRLDSIESGRLGGEAVADGFDFERLQTAIIYIDSVLYGSEAPDADTVDNVRMLFKQLIEESHQYQQDRDFLNREVALERQMKSYESYRNSLVFSVIALILGLIVAVYLYRNNKRLLDMQAGLEDRVEQRTHELMLSNISLKSEIQERYKVEEQLRNSQMIAEEAKERVEYQANFDSLTKLANRNLFEDRFSQAIARARRDGSQVALLFLDLDRFKHINDTLGHSVGDELLREASGRILNVLRESDTASRFGGDEFAVVLPDVRDPLVIEHIVGRILDELSMPYRLDGNDAFVSASIGVTIFPDDGDSTGTLLRKADSAMYKAKERGRNNFQFFTPQMDIEAHDRRKLEAALYDALEHNEFMLNYQPVFNPHTGRLVGAEALIRWYDHENGFVAPDVFIPLAEEIGLIVPIGEWVLREACRQAVRWKQTSGLPLHLAVNMSYRQFQKQDVAAMVAGVLKDTGLEPERLVLEITEGLMMADDQGIHDQLDNIRQQGVSLAIDDFGTGYSSLSYLKKFPINILKIDRSFVKDLTVDPDDDELVKGILSMAQSLKLQVVAEGVENREQEAFLVSNQCLFTQGYYYSRPLSQPDFERYLMQSAEAYRSA